MSLIQTFFVSVLLLTTACSCNSQQALQVGNSDSSPSSTLTDTTKMILFDAQEKDALGQWKVVDDVVMGGRSDGNIQASDAGNFVFQGEVSLENNGGFSSVRMSVAEKQVSDFTHVDLRVKGDGKRYQFRLKSEQQEYFSYIQHFETSGDWETLSLKLADFYPTFRGRELDLPNYPGKMLSEVAILIANGQAESFNLEVAEISLRK